MLKNASLCTAKVRHDDEYYTRLEDIQPEFQRHLEDNPSLFTGKVVYCPCDHPLRSNFVRYFLMNFQKLGLARLIATSYTPGGKGLIFDYARDSDIRFKTDADLSPYLHELSGDGDFRSEEVTAFWQAADIVATNPPFSLIHALFSRILDGQKECFILAPQYAAIYGKIFPAVRQQELWMDIPDRYPSFLDPNGKTKKFGNICWLTSFPDKHRKPMELRPASQNLQENEALRRRLLRSYGEICYQPYHNFTGIDVPRLDAIPSDYTAASWACRSASWGDMIHGNLLSLVLISTTSSTIPSASVRSAKNLSIPSSSREKGDITRKT